MATAIDALPGAATPPAVPSPRTGSISAAIAAVADRVRQSVPVVLGRGGNGAGVVWRPDGQIVTNAHVVRDDRADVLFSDGRRFTGIVAARHPDRDIAVIKIAADNLPAVEVGDSSTVRPGQLAIAIGHPIGFREAVTAGIIVAAGQAATQGGPRTGDYLQTDVTLLPGNSGGPLLDAWGRVIGINSMVSGRLSLAIPSQAVERFVDGGKSGSAVYLGINGVVVPLRRQDHAAGFLLTEILEGTPADRAGLIVGDVVVVIGSTSVTDQESLPAALLRLAPGEAVNLDVLRGGEPRSFVVVPTERA
ncbi:MAG: trypsin-like peptidase domain-containing protein [Chloroflexota bacterium]|nr:trypsin-like peptidase domain-containing protein [Chloroflexota bacterium]